MGELHSMPPRGYYTAAEAGQLVGVSSRRIGAWARYGYIRSSQSDGPPRIYSFQDVAEAMVVAILIDRGAAGPGVKTAIAELRQRHGHDWPLSYSDLASAGRTIVVVDEPLTDIARGQQSQVYEADLVRVRDSLRNGGWAAEKTGATHIEVDPDRLSGRPAIRGRRMAVEDTARIAETRGGRELLKDGYDLTDEEIDDAVAWWEAARRLEQAA